MAHRALTSALPLAVLLLLAAPQGAAHVACAPESCVQVVPLPDLPYVSGPVTLRSFGANVTIVDALARTSLRIELANNGPAPAEADIALPLPDAASLTAFNLSWSGHLLVGRVAERGQAIQEYNDAQAAGLDAALLQEADRHLVRLQVNVGAGEARVLQASYVEPVPLVAGARVYRLPLSHLEPAPGNLSVDVRVASRLGIASLRSAGLPVPLDAGAGHLDLSSPAAVQDLILVWGEEGAARTVLAAAADPGSGPTEYWAQVCADGTPLDRDVVFILDRSGSMSGLKIEEARETLSGALGTMRPGDRYSIVTFSSDVTPFAAQLVPGDASHVSADQGRAAQVQAEGGTNLDSALGTAFSQLAAAESPRLPMVVLLTDGLPTVGVTDHAQIIERAQAANTRHAPLIVVPIGLDADQTFLADLALRSGGAFVDVGAPDASLSDHLVRLAEVLAGAVVMQPQLTVQGASDVQMLPRTLPPLYAESCLDVRFHANATGPMTLALSGKGANGTVQSSTTFPLVSIPVVPAVANLWGRAVVADLLAQERLEPSPALRQSIIDNATRMSQLSPYTAWVLADMSPAPLPAEGDAGGQGASSASGSMTAAASSTGSVVSMPGGQPGAAYASSGGAGGAASGGKSNTPGPGAALVAVALLGLAVALRRRT